MKKLFYPLLLILILPIILANDITLGLNLNDEYGPNQIISGTLSLTFDELPASSLIKVYIDNTKKTEKTLKNSLDEALINYDLLPAVYELKTAQSSITTNEVTVIRIRSQLEDISFNITGFSENLTLDIGNDNIIDYQYINPNIFTFSNPIYLPNTSNININNADAEAIIEKNVERCQDFDLDFSNLYDQTTLEINANAKKLADGGNLTAYIKYSGIIYTCDLQEPTNTFTQVNCKVIIPNPDSANYRVCLKTSSGSPDIDYYSVPLKFVNNIDYYFITLKKAIFDTKLNGTIKIDSQNILDEVNTYFNICNLEDNFCKVPIKVNSFQEITLNNLIAHDTNNILYNTFYDINYIEPSVSLSSIIDLPLEVLNVSAPSDFGNYDFEIRLADENVEQSFSVIEIPVAKFTTNKQVAAISEPIIFDASSSTTPDNVGIKDYGWDFGDSTIINTKDSRVTHSYSSSGTKIISLVITDINNQDSAEAKKTITIKSATDSINDLIEDTKEAINSTEILFATTNPEIKDTITILDYDTMLDNARTQLSSIELTASNIANNQNLDDDGKDREYSALIDDIITLQNTIVTRISISEFQFDNIVDYDDIPNPNRFASGITNLDATKNLIFSSQKDISVTAITRKVNVIFLSGKEENFRLIKKTIASTNAPVSILEYSPFSIDQIITTGNKIDPNLIKFPGNIDEIIYTIGDGDLLETKDTKTFVLPDLSNIQSIEPTCGDSICQYNLDLNIDESDTNNQYYCQEDCNKKINWFLIIFLIIVALAGVYYFNFYKGQFHFKSIFNKFSFALFKKKIFIAPQDMINLKDFINKSLAKNLSKQQISKILIEKGWNQKQVDYVFIQLKK